jgi:Fur family transcriptional regulator, stress-responsive regulator
MTPLLDVASRVTRPGVAVLTEVNAHPQVDLDTLTAEVRARMGSVSTQTVYDVLHVLAEAALVRRTEPAGSAARFEAPVGDNHHHVVCRTCDDVADIDCATGSAPCLRASNTNGFTIDDAEATYGAPAPPASEQHRGPSRTPRKNKENHDRAEWFDDEQRRAGYQRTQLADAR